VAAPPLDSPCEGPVTYPGDIKTLIKSSKRKKQADTQYDYTARFDGQRFGKLKKVLQFTNCALGKQSWEGQVT